jgi:prophage antirepressor-like protein
MNTQTLQSMVKGELFGKNVRVVQGADGEPRFVASDIGDILGLNHVRMAMKNVFEEDKGVTIVDTLGGAQKLVTVNESGMYKLIFSSRKPEARAFSRWVTSVVLPSIRKSGIYSGEGDVGMVWLTAANYIRIRGIEASANAFGRSAGVRAKKLCLEVERHPCKGNFYRAKVLDATYDHLSKRYKNYPAAKRGPVSLGGSVLEFSYPKKEVAV